MPVLQSLMWLDSSIPWFPTVLVRSSMVDLNPINISKKISFCSGVLPNIGLGIDGFGSDPLFFTLVSIFSRVDEVSLLSGSLVLLVPLTWRNLHVSTKHLWCLMEFLHILG